MLMGVRYMLSLKEEMVLESNFFRRFSVLGVVFLELYYFFFFLGFLCVFIFV